MQPQGLIGQLNQSMAQGQPALSQVSSTSPNFDPSLAATPSTPTPNRSPMSMIHKDHLSAIHGAFQRRGMPVPSHLQGGTQPDQGGMVTLPTMQDANKGEQGTQVPITEAMRIVQALDHRLKTLSKNESAIHQALFPPAAPQEPQGESA